ncbi:DnaJ subfamily C member 12, partial [Clarias magur]
MEEQHCRRSQKSVPMEPKEISSRVLEKARHWAVNFRHVVLHPLIFGVGTQLTSALHDKTA